MIALDTNLLLYAFDWATAEHERSHAVLAALRTGGSGWGLTLASVVEFWNLATRPFAGRPVGTVEEARGFLGKLIGDGAQLWQPLPGFGVRLMRSAQEQGIAGRRIFDWQIALTALESGATELWTHDTGFRAPQALRLFDPLS